MSQWRKGDKVHVFFTDWINPKNGTCWWPGTITGFQTDEVTPNILYETKEREAGVDLRRLKRVAEVVAGNEGSATDGNYCAGNHAEEWGPGDKLLERSKDQRNVSGFNGVTPVGNRWVAMVRRSHKNTHVGTYDTPLQAARARRSYLVAAGDQDAESIDETTEQAGESEGDMSEEKEETLSSSLHEPKLHQRQLNLTANEANGARTLQGAGLSTCATCMEDILPDQVMCP